MKEDRFLTGILIGIALLVVASLSAFFLREDSNSYLTENSPEAVVHNYILAVQQENFNKAYSYLAEDEFKPTYAAFLRDISMSNHADVQIGDAEISEETASVQLTFTNTNGRIFFDQYDYMDAALLIQQNGEWKILQMAYSYWSWSWYQEEG